MLAVAPKTRSCWDEESSKAGAEETTPSFCFMAKSSKEHSSGRTEWIMDSGCTNHMTGDRNLLMLSSLSPSSKKTITFVDKGKSKVLGLGRVAISQDQNIDKVMLVESLGYNLMPVSMLCDLDLVVLFGKYGCLAQMVSDNSIVFRGV